MSDSTLPADSHPTQEDTPARSRNLGRWYVVQTLAGHEKKVQAALQGMFTSTQFQDRLFEALIPVDESIEVRKGVKTKSSKKRYPGYVFVRCLLDEEVWAAIRRTPSVSGFSGSTQRDSLPSPLPEREVEALLGELPPSVPSGLVPGNVVRVLQGPFADFTGSVVEVNQDRVKVALNVFGRETLVEAPADQVERT